MRNNRHETLHKCTGVHTAVLSEEGTVGTFLWTKAQIADPEDPGGSSVPMWGPLIRSLDADRDVILFPSEDSTPSSQFEWNGPSSPDSATRYRLIVLEATWVFAKGT